MQNKNSQKLEKIIIKHIAKVAGVSVSTVSRALRNDPSASLKTIDRILAIAKKLNYYPDSLAKSLRQKRTNTIGIIFNDLNNPNDRQSYNHPHEKTGGNQQESSVFSDIL